MNLKQIPPAKPYFPKEDIQFIHEAIDRILDSGMLTLGEYTKKFETEFSKLCKTKRAVAVNSGTAALEIALRSLGLKTGDEVLVPTNTFTATAATVLLAGGKPVFTDVDPKSLCINLKNVKKHLTGKTRGVMAVHIGGLICPEVKAISEFCKEKNLFLIEDAAHAQGSTLDHRPAGSFGDAGCFSFYPTKVMTTGEGGMITTDREDLANKATVLRDQGKSSFSGNEIVEVGSNWRMTEISAAIGLSQLSRLQKFITQRNKIASHFNKELTEAKSLEPLEIPKDAISNYYKYVAFVPSKVSRDDFKLRLREKGVRPSGEVYWPPLHMQPIYKRLLEVKEGLFPDAEDVCHRMICLPIYSQMTLDEARYVTEKVAEVSSSFR